MILVTGGTGLVGAHLLLYLVRNNRLVKAIYRPNSNLERVKKVFGYYSDQGGSLFQKIQWIPADLSDIPSLETAFKDVTHVYHAAALISFDPKAFKNLRKTNVTGTANIVNLCIAQGVKKLCYVSSIATIGKSPEGAVTEENDHLEEDANVYAQTKYEAELHVWRGSQEGLPVVIVNPGIIIGPGFWDGASGRLFTTANKGYRHFPPGGSCFVSVGDVVRSMIQLMESAIQNERFIVMAENRTYKEILDTMAPLLNRPKPKKSLTIGQLRLLRVLDWLQALFTGRARRITRRTIAALQNPQIYSNAKLESHLEFVFEALEKALAFSCVKFREEHP
ncbi:MAG: NAD-dependent epimerase/dehydratase family protein [Bacteroidota bacterium]